MAAKAAKREEHNERSLMKRIAVGAFLAGASALLLAAPTGASLFQSAAIGYSPETGYAGSANFVDGVDLAKSIAIDQCRQAGGTDCQAVASVTDGCVVLIVDAQNDWMGGSGVTRDAAISNARETAQANGVDLDPAQEPYNTFCTF